MQVKEDGGIPLSDSFRTSQELDDLARSQGVVAMEDIRTLFGTWPGELNDGFEELIDDLRSQGEHLHIE